MKNTYIAAAFAAIGMAVSSASMAQQKPESGWYVGGSIGQSEAQDLCDGISGCDDTDTAWKIFGGYHVNRNFAIEGGYTDLGKSTINATGPGGNLNATIEATAFELVGLGSLPLGNQFSVFGKIGLYRGEVEARGSGVVLGAPVNLSEDDSGTDLTFGFGARLDITRNFGVRGEWQRYSDMGGDIDIDVLSVGVVFRFQ